MFLPAAQVKKRRLNGSNIGLGLLYSALFHGLFYLLTTFILTPKASDKSNNKIPVKINFLQRSKAQDERIKAESPQQKVKDLERERRIIEAPLLATEKPDTPAFLGAQDHKTREETKTEAKSGQKGAEPSALQNGVLRLEAIPVPEGRFKVAAGKSYRDYLPKTIDIINTGHNDFLPDKKLKIGPVIDVNTTDFRFIAYFTAVRKQVELAYYDIGPDLQDKSYVRDKIANSGQARLEGSSVVQLKIARSGVLIESKLVDSSGDKDINQFWQRVLNLAAPYPPLPRDFPDAELSFTYKLYYDLSFQGERKAKRFIF